MPFDKNSVPANIVRSRTIKKKKKKEVQHFYCVLLTFFCSCERMWNGKDNDGFAPNEYLPVLATFFLHKRSNIFGMKFFLSLYRFSHLRMHETNQKRYICEYRALDGLEYGQPFEKFINCPTLLESLLHYVHTIES